MKFVVLGLGSNKKWNGTDCISLLAGACDELKKTVCSAEFSSIYSTKPMYYESQDNFFNMVMTGLVSDDIDAFTFLSEIHRIEEKFGRNRNAEIRNGPRSLDIDIEFFGEEEISSPELQIPHPRIKERAFVLVPMLEIFENSADFKRKEEIRSLVKNLSGSDEIVKILSSDEFKKLLAKNEPQEN